MNYQTRSLRAAVALMMLGVVTLLTVDAVAHTTAGLPYNYGVYTTVTLALVALAVALLAWNVTEYALKRKR